MVHRIESVETLTLERSKEETRQTAQTVKLLILSGGLISLRVLAWAILMITRSPAKQRRIEEQRLLQGLRRAIESRRGRTKGAPA